MNTPDWNVSEWLNVEGPLSLEGLKGKVVVMETFQMLCPGCVATGLPQAQRVADSFSPDDVQVIGLHSVFEHHQAQGHRAALEAFLHEYRYTFPVAIDRVDDAHRQPATMRAYGMQGTPTLVLFDRSGQRVLQHFGHLPDLVLGAKIERLKEARGGTGDQAKHEARATREDTAESCGEAGCLI